ncbi:MAG: type IV pili methyl-accepting chemotaxis transducer N-terminal domain-containing protein [Pseudomonadota bacterium]
MKFALFPAASRLAGALALGAVTAFGAPGAVDAAGPDVDPATAKRHVNLAALQPMLAEQIAKAACFAHLGVNPSAQMQYLRGAHGLFEQTHRGMRKGNSALGLVAETHPNLLQALDAVDRDAGRWMARSAALSNGDGDISAQALEALMRDTASATAVTEALSQRTARTYGADKGVPLALSVRIDLASRQRLMSQRIAKDYCLIAAGEATPERRAALSEAVTLFDNSLEALIEGVDAFGLPAETDVRRLALLNSVGDAWREMRPYVTAVAGGATPDAAAISAVAWVNNVVLTQANAAVFAYETGGVEG